MKFNRLLEHLICEQDANDIANELLGRLGNAVGDMAFDLIGSGASNDREKQLIKVAKTVRDPEGWLADWIYNDAYEFVDMLGDWIYEKSEESGVSKQEIYSKLKEVGHKALTIAIDHLENGTELKPELLPEYEEPEEVEEEDEDAWKAEYLKDPEEEIKVEVKVELVNDPVIDEKLKQFWEEYFKEGGYFDEVETPITFIRDYKEYEELRKYVQRQYDNSLELGDDGLEEIMYLYKIDYDLRVR